MTRMVQACEGIEFRRSLVGWVGMYRGKTLVAKKLTRGPYRWDVRTGTFEGRQFLGRGQTMWEAVAAAKQAISGRRYWACTSCSAQVTTDITSLAGTPHDHCQHQGYWVEAPAPEVSNVDA